ncbi:transglutaminase TgpA family protein [Paenibacillus guangzhouensis]|uniref:transglutaminase TgpA family protein n=1 Tax=Paenibacillus guangzhouensis TaxID=1473112 RepID=UPI001266B2BA|nr:transglutaminaseTgpA domain-containing protein [Paenibacillus guangzhouensis]
MGKWLPVLFRNLRTDGLHQLMMLYAAAMLWQWTEPLETIWWEETMEIVRLTLISAVVIHFFIPLRLWIRRVLIVLVMLLIHYQVLRAYHLYAATSEHALENTVEFAKSMFPYILFALGAWVLLEFMMGWVRSRVRIVALIVLQMIGLAILDSFTTMNLWLAAAWTMLLGLAWLITAHCVVLRDKYPEGWRHLASYPLRLITTVGLLLSIIFLVGISMPSTAPLVTDPYTLWKTWKGEAVPVFYNAKDGEKIQVGIYRSGYGRDDSELGSGFTFDYSNVMQITTNRKSYWRGETRSIYTGKGWELPPEKNRGDLNFVTLNQPLDSKGVKFSKGIELTATVTVTRAEPYPVLFGAYPIRQVSAIGGEGNMSNLRWDSNTSTLTWAETAAPTYPKQYTIVSQIPEIDEQELRRVSAMERTSLPTDLVDDLKLPNELPRRVHDLAQSITKGLSNDYDRVSALKTYLTTSGLKYTNEPDLTWKMSNDFVDSFLFEIKEGYCDYFSTSLVVMTRSLGIPARWVKGYMTGAKAGPRPDQMSSYAMQEEMQREEGTYYISNADAHSWAEVYFEGYGWVPFEATPGFSIPVASPQAEQEASTLPIQADETLKNEVTNSGKPAEVSPLMIYGAISIVLIFALWFLVWKYRLLGTIWWRAMLAGRRPSSGQKLVVLTEHWIRYCRRKGLRREDHETLRESITRWEQEMEGLRGSWNVLLALFEQTMYSTKQVTEQDWFRAQLEMKKLMERL